MENGKRKRKLVPAPPVEPPQESDPMEDLFGEITPVPQAPAEVPAKKKLKAKKKVVIAEPSPASSLPSSPKSVEEMTLDDPLDKLGRQEAERLVQLRNP